MEKSSLMGQSGEKSLNQFSDKADTCIKYNNIFPSVSRMRKVSKVDFFGIDSQKISAI